MVPYDDKDLCQQIILSWRHQMETFSVLLAFLRGIHRLSWSFDFFICAWTNNWANTEGTGDLRRRCAIVMLFFDSTELFPETILTQYYWYQYISVQCHRKWEWYAGKTYNFKIILKDFSISTRGQWVQSATTELNVSFLIECHIHIKCIDSSCVTRDYNSCP